MSFRIAGLNMMSDTRHMTSTDTYYPRVLVIVGAPFNKRTATGFTLTNLFKGWPTESLAQIYTAAMCPDTEVCTNYFRLGLDSLRLPHFLRRKIAAFGARPMANCTEPRDRLGDSEGQKGQTSRAFWVSLRHIRQSLGSVLDLVPYQLSRELLSWIADFSPEVIYSFLASIRIMGLVEYLARELQIPVIPHFMDDWPETLYRKHILSFWLVPQLQKRLVQVLNLSASVLTISDAMAQEYAVRYSKPFVSFMNCVDRNLFAERHRWNQCATFANILVMGNLGRGRMELLRDVTKAVLALQQNGTRVRVSVYTDRFWQHAAHGAGLAPCHLCFFDPPDDEGLGSVLAEADVVVHLDSFDPGDVKYFRYSMSAKLPAYLMSGAPIVVYGPDCSAIAKYAVRTGWGMVVGSRDVSTLAESLGELVASIELRTMLGRRARNAALQNHEGLDQRRRFRELLAKVVEEYHSPDVSR